MKTKDFLESKKLGDIASIIYVRVPNLTILSHLYFFPVKDSKLYNKLLESSFKAYEGFINELSYNHIILCTLDENYQYETANKKFPFGRILATTDSVPELPTPNHLPAIDIFEDSLDKFIDFTKADKTKTKELVKRVADEYNQMRQHELEQAVYKNP